MLRIVVATLVLALWALPALADEYTFTVENNSNQRIVKIDVSEDGSHWERFDIGGGIASGKSVVLAWDASTDNRNCEWQFRATFSGGDALESDWVDFCTEDVVLSFEFDE